MSAPQDPHPAPDAQHRDADASRDQSSENNQRSENTQSPESNESAAEVGQRERKHIAGRAGIVAAGTLTSRLLGLVREQVFAAMFTRAATDVFFVAFLIPNVLRQLVAEGAVQTGVLPVLTDVERRHGPARAQRFFAALRGLSLLVLLGLSVLGVVFAPQLVALFAGGYKQVPGQFERTVQVTRWVFPYIFFMGTAALGVAALNTQKRFVVTSFAPLLLNVAFIACALTLPSWFEGHGIDPLFALATGVLLGGALQVIAQWPSLKKVGYLSLPRFDFGDEHVREVLRRLGPVLFGFGIYYVDVVVARHLLSDLGIGAQSYFGFALRLCDFPQGIFVMAVSSATLPSLALLASRDDRSELVSTFSHSLRLALFVAVPASIAFMVLSEPLVALVFERGHFDRTATIETARALFAQGAGIWAVACVRQVVIVFYALGDTRTPVWISGCDFLVFFGSALLLGPRLGHVGVSWAVSIASFAQFALLVWALRKRLGSLQGRRTLWSVAKAAGAALFASGAALGLGHLAAGAVQSTVVTGVVCCVTFGVLFLAGAVALRCEELQTVLGPLRRRLARRRSH